MHLEAQEHGCPQRPSVQRALQTVQEGNLVPDENMNDLAITGLAIKKSTLPKQTRDELQKILYEPERTAGM